MLRQDLRIAALEPDPFAAYVGVIEKKALGVIGIEHGHDQSRWAFGAVINSGTWHVSAIVWRLEEGTAF
ncbi:hypothetical protein MT1_0545 [Pseudomonas sp. MT-1]|nr:hypothetical protein MT1_0545 [Pseudomonas sp. MT-1]